MLLPGQDGAPARFRYVRESSTRQPTNYAAADLGRRPRRATAWPGIFPAQASQRSACFEPRRPSVKLMRITAPFASSTSLPQLSHTSLVTRATDFLPRKNDFDCADITGKIRELRSSLSLLNSPRTEQAQEGLFLEVET